MFWEDVWWGNQTLKSLYPRIHMLDSHKNCCVAHRLPPHEWNMVLRRDPRGGIEASQFNELRLHIESVVLNSNRDSWSWTPNIHNGFSVSRLPRFGFWTLIETLFHEDVETVNHILFTCDLAKDMWSLLAKWWELDVPFCTNILEWLSWIDSIPIDNKARTFLNGVGGTLMWSLWSFRNRLVFSNNPPKKSLLWDSIVSFSYLWISSRNPKLNISWVGWLRNPLVFITFL